ncbi:MAG: hypothetical protein ACLQUR_04585 [Limisphaerales bacterium]
MNNVPVWKLGDGVFLLSDLDINYSLRPLASSMTAGGMRTMDGLSPGDGAGGGTYAPDGSNYTPPNYGTNLYLECLAISNNIVNGLIHNSSPLVPYTLSSMQSLLWPAWNAEATFYGSGFTNFTSFNVPRLGRNMLFLRARSSFAPRIIGAGVSHNVVIRRDGTVWAWGANGNGQLGNGQTTDSSAPVQVTGLSNIVALSVAPDDSFALALDANGKVWSWGANGSGQLGRGDGLYADEDTPAVVPGLSNIVAVAGGTGHAIALRSDGTVWAWGGNDYGDLGDGSGTGRDYAAPVPGLTNAIGIASGDYHNFALCANGNVWGWGLNEIAELGIGNEDDQPLPVLVSALTNAVALSGGYFHSIALLSDGTVKAWGENYYGEIGNLSSFMPVPVFGLSNIVAIACGGYHNLFLDQSGRLWVWGNDWWNQLGDGGTGSTVPFMLTSVSDVTAIAGGGTSSMISTADGSIYTWGSSYESQATPTLMDLYANYSSDGSGLPDWWEIQYFGHLGLDPNADPVGDGWTLLQDYEQGLNPTNFITPPTPSGLVVTQNTNQFGVTLTWNAASPPPVNYIILRSDFNEDTLNYVVQQIGGVASNVTSFVDNEAVGGADANSFYEIEAVYPGGSSRLSAQAYINSTPPAALNYSPATAQLVRNATGRWQLMFSSLPASVQTIQLTWIIFYWTDFPNYYSDTETQTILPGSVTDGIYQIPDADAVRYLGYTVYVEGLETDALPGQGYYVGVLSDDAPYFVDGRQHMKQNLNFLIRGASLYEPFNNNVFSSSLTPFSGRFNQTATNFEEFSFLYHDTALDDLWPFTANYYLADFLLDLSRTNDDQFPIGTTNFTFQPNFATNIPAPPILTHTDPYWILQPAFHTTFGYAGYAFSNSTNWGVTVTHTNTVASLQTGLNNLFGLPYQTGCMVDLLYLVDPRIGWYIYDPIYEPLAPGDTITAEYATDYYYFGLYYYCFGAYASWCPAPTLNFVNYYFAPLINPNANTIGLPSLSQQPYPLPIDDNFAVTNQTPAVMFGAVGQPMILGAWAKYSIQGSSPTKYAYLGQYFFTNAFKVDANGNITSTNTGVVSPYGEFFPTQPGPVALITMPDIDTGMQATGIVQVISLALDANHDGTIDTTFNGPDFVSANHPYRFWVNNNYDRWATTTTPVFTETEQDDVLQGEDGGPLNLDPNDPDYDYKDLGGNRIIPCTRDLEDFARLWVCGVTSNLLAALPSGSTVTLSWGDVGNPNSSNPTIDLFQAADADGGIGYLTNSTIASRQIDPTQNQYIHRLGPGDSIQLNNPYLPILLAGGHFIWCGVTNGTGTLTLTIADANSNVLAKTSTYIQLVDIKQMYERWTVRDDPSQPPAVTAQIATNDLPSGVIWPFQYANPGNANTPYILHVHGFNVAMWEKDRYAETEFKRLYWQGYQGRFGEFRWPTTLQTANLRAFDNSEIQAWNSAPGLLNLLIRLNNQYPGDVYLTAHSHGNVVVGEALRLATQQGLGQLVNTYVAMQAAVDSHTYDPTTPTRPVSFSTPDRYGQYYTNGAPSYFNGSAGAGTYVNFFNPNDWALNTSIWQRDQNQKPDAGYGYSSTYDTWWQVGVFTNTPLVFPQNTYNIYSYCDQAHGYALGAQPDVGGAFMTGINHNQVELDADPFDFGTEHIYHSGEFRSDNAQRWQFWNEVLVKMKLKSQ